MLVYLGDSTMNRRKIEFVFYGSIVVFFIELLLAKLGYLKEFSVNNWMLLVIALPPFSVNCCLILLIYKKISSAKMSGWANLFAKICFVILTLVTCSVWSIFVWQFLV